MEVKVLFFASFKERTGIRERDIELPVDTKVIDLKHLIVEQYPVLKPYLTHMVVSVNRNFAFDHEPIPEFAEVAFFPPVSGGDDELPTITMVTEGRIEFEKLIELITIEQTGAACIFSGMVRGVTERTGVITDYLEYEAYVPMVEIKMRQVAFEIREKWPTVQGIAIVQRTGILYPRTPTVMIACTAAHRDTGIFEAARYGIDRLKEIVPVWKRETGPTGETWIEGEYLPGPTDR